MKNAYTLAAILLLLCATVVHGSEGWGTDLEAAKAAAEKDGKDILMEVTGSDW